MSIDYVAEIEVMTLQLRAREKDASFTGAPALDSYSRISRKKSRNDDDKTVVQTWRNLKIILSMRALLGEILVDEARSAWKKTGKRPGFNELVERCELAKSNGVVSQFVDRLARQSWDMERLIHAGEVHQRYLVVTPYDTYDFSDWRQLEKLRTEVQAAQRDSAIKSEKIKAKVAVRLAAGSDFNGPSPFGHRWPSEVETISDEQLAVERDAIRWGYTNVLSGGSWGQVAVEWNRRGLLTRRGFTWNHGNVRECLVLPRHAGYVRHKKAVLERRDESEAIIDVATWKLFQELLSTRTKGSQPSGKITVDGELIDSPHFLSTVLRCGKVIEDPLTGQLRICGRGMVGGTESKRYPDGDYRRIYRCPPKGCKGCAVDARMAERWASKVALGILTAPEHSSMLARTQADLAELATKIRTLEEAIDRLDSQAPSVHSERRARHDKRVEALEAELAPLLSKREELQMSRPVEADPEAVQAMVDRWEDPDTTPAQLRQMTLMALPQGFYCKPVGRRARLRGDAILQRFSVDAPLITE